MTSAAAKTGKRQEDRLGWILQDEVKVTLKEVRPARAREVGGKVGRNKHAPHVR